MLSLLWYIVYIYIYSIAHIHIEYLRLLHFAIACTFCLCNHLFCCICTFGMPKVQSCFIIQGHKANGWIASSFWLRLFAHVFGSFVLASHVYCKAYCLWVSFCHLLQLGNELHGCVTFHVSRKHCWRALQPCSFKRRYTMGRFIADNEKLFETGDDVFFSVFS